MSTALSPAAEFVAVLAKEYAVKSRESLLALPPVTALRPAESPAGFEFEVECLPMLNGACAVTVEASEPYLFGLRWRNIVSGFEVSPEGEVTFYPQRVLTESAKERKHRKAWHA